MEGNIHEVIVYQTTDGERFDDRCNAVLHELRYQFGVKFDAFIFDREPNSGNVLKFILTNYEDVMLIIEEIREIRGDRT